MGGQELKPRKRPRLRILLLFFSLFALALLAADWLAGRWVIPSQQSVFRYRHPFFHHGLLPNVAADTSWENLPYRVSTNSLGCRDFQPRSVALQSDRPRVVIIGDSFTEGMGLDYADCFGGILTANASQAGVEVLNTATVSYSPKIYHLRIKYLLEQAHLRFDTLVVMLDISDIQDEMFYESFQPRMSFSLASRIDGFLFRHSFTYHTVSRSLVPQRRISNQSNDVAQVNIWMDSPVIPDSLDEYQIMRWGWTLDHPDFRPMRERGLELATQQMQQLVDLCKSKEIDVHLVVYPSPVQILARDKDCIQVRHWRQFSAQNHLGFVDLFPPFFDQRHGTAQEVFEKFFIPDDVHWNRAGHRLVADVLARQIPLAASPPSPQTNEACEHPD